MLFFTVLLKHIGLFLYVLSLSSEFAHFNKSLTKKIWRIEFFVVSLFIMEPKFIHSYPYECTFLGTFNNCDLYHSVTFEGPMLISRYGNGGLQFTGENCICAKGDEHDEASSIGEAFRRAKSKLLKLDIDYGNICS